MVFKFPKYSLFVLFSTKIIFFRLKYILLYISCYICLINFQMGFGSDDLYDDGQHHASLCSFIFFKQSLFLLFLLLLKNAK